ncbi:IS3 family transposase [Desulfofundulus thermobenzoicus]|uniref:IS3 family transposase n=1 Tax=Desulfofundulus thermobenzoicus TaxID=29376 RepID=A0A6N7INS6_9FIRM|nr:IS3 family transposase [Desulfofundulus thermobenzoicus]MQL51624.1 IS3 family transposase [Desulfofundulus thermobenzoicus]
MHKRPKPKNRIHTGGRPKSHYTLTKSGAIVSNEQVKEWICELIAGEEYAYGYLKLSYCLRKKFNLIINKKKVYRLCKELAILRPQRKINRHYPRKLTRNRLVTASNQLRWIPEKVRPLFEKELARVNNEGRELLNKALPEGVDNFVKSCREQVIKDANLMYQEFHPGEVLSEEVITKILDDLKERLNKAFAGKFIPEVNYNRIGFHFQRGSDWFLTGARLCCCCKK